jgi:hypothetical protein
MATWLPFIVSFPLLFFWAWMFWEMAENPRIRGREHLFWTIAFVFASVITAGYYFFTEYRHK